MAYGTPNFYQQTYTFQGGSYFDSRSLAPSLPDARVTYGASNRFPEWYENNTTLDYVSFINRWEDQCFGVEYTSLDPDYPSIEDSNWYPHLQIQNTHPDLTGSTLKTDVPDLIERYRANYGLPAYTWTYWKGFFLTPFNDFRVVLDIKSALGRPELGGGPTIGTAGHESEWFGDTSVLDIVPGFTLAGLDWGYWNVCKIPADPGTKGKWWRSITNDA